MRSRQKSWEVQVEKQSERRRQKRTVEAKANLRGSVLETRAQQNRV